MNYDSPSRHVLLIFLDGIGIGEKDPGVNPFFHARLPFLRRTLGGRLPESSSPVVEGESVLCVPADATLGIPGLPQSGTGQATLYTGRNTSRIIGKHFGPYLYSTLKPVVAEHNIFEQLQNLSGESVTMALANAFPQKFFDYLNGHRRRMVAGMFAALSSEIPFRDITFLKTGNAVSTDITAARWNSIGHPDAPVVSATAAGNNLARIAAHHNFTLFEYFLTDKAGHERDMEIACGILEEIDVFLQGVLDGLDPANTLLIVTSDHGNLENLSTKSHTRNPVPVFLAGESRYEAAGSVTDISHICEVILTFLRQ